jgi:hypothetical protein
LFLPRETFRGSRGLPGFPEEGTAELHWGALWDLAVFCQRPPPRQTFPHGERSGVLDLEFSAHFLPAAPRRTFRGSGLGIPRSLPAGNIRGFGTWNSAELARGKHSGVRDLEFSKSKDGTATKWSTSRAPASWNSAELARGKHSGVRDLEFSRRVRCAAGNVRLQTWIFPRSSPARNIPGFSGLGVRRGGRPREKSRDGTATKWSTSRAPAL